MARRCIPAFAAAVLVCGAFNSYAAEPHKQQVERYVVPAASITGRVPGTTVIHLAIGLPPKDAAGLRTLAAAVSDPGSGQFRKFLTVEQSTERFGPMAADYQALIAWAQANNLTVEVQYPHRLLLGVRGAAADVEQALAVQLGYARRPDGTTFYKPDRAPSVDLDVRVSHIAGVDNVFVPRHRGGSQGGGTSYGFPDLRNAYAAACLGLSGGGQSVGLMAYGGYNHNDIAGYEAAVGITNTNPTCGASTPGSVPCLNDNMQPGFTGPINSYSAEATADVEMAIAMAPGLHQVEVFEGDPNLGCTSGDNMIAAMSMATDVKQFSSSVSFCVSDDASIIQLMAASGQSFFVPSGDDGTGVTGTSLNFNYYLNTEVTVVGGTALSMNGTGASYQSELASKFSGGGVENIPGFTATCPANCTPGNPGCSSNCIPSWQQGVANATNGASATYRNDPDLAMPAQSLFLYFNGVGGNQTFCGTSASAPLMAGFLALANQQQCLNAAATCANNGGGMGFVSPALYAVGMNPAVYAKSFHKVVGNTPTNACGAGQSAPAVTGYNLATGWGSPTCGLVDQLSCTTCSAKTASAGTPPSAACVSFQSDSNNCGSCGNVCAANSICVRGNCQAGSSVGDTHLTTFNGLYYDFQASGDFLLVETDSGFTVQTRQASGAPRWPNASVNKAVATQIDKTRVAVCLDPTRLVVDGKPDDLPDGKSLSLAGGVDVAHSGNVYVITGQRGETVRAELNNGWINVSVGLGQQRQATVRGLLGNARGTTADDIATRDGTVLTQPVSFADLYHRYADSWRIAAADSLVCADPKVEPGVPDASFYANDLDPEQYARVRAICTAAGVREETLLDACTLDTAVLGDEKAAMIFTRVPAPADFIRPVAQRPQ